MATYDLECQGCGEPFVAKSPRAKWCRPGCKKRVQREAVDVVEPPVVPDDDGPEVGLVAEVRRELEAACRVETFAGQLALVLARKVSAVDVSGASSLSKELRQVMAEALDGVEKPAPVEPVAEQEPVEDEVEKARRRRDEAREAAGLS